MVIPRAADHRVARHIALQVELHARREPGGEIDASGRGQENVGEIGIGIGVGEQGELVEPADIGPDQKPVLQHIDIAERVVADIAEGPHRIRIGTAIKAGGPAVSRHTFADEDVIAAIAKQAVVIARQRNVGNGAKRIIAQAAMGRVTAGSGVDEVVVGTTVDRICASTSLNDVIARVAENRVAVEAAVDGVDFAAAMDGVGARVAVDRVGAGVAEDCIHVVAATDDVAAITAMDRVIAIGAHHRVIHRAGVDRVITAKRVDLVLPGIGPVVGWRRAARGEIVCTFGQGPGWHGASSSCSGRQEALQSVISPLRAAERAQAFPQPE